MKKVISVVIPAFNEQDSIKHSVPRIEMMMESIVLIEPKKLDYEIIIVDDGSTDNTLQNAILLKSKNKRIRIVKMKGNFGHMYALEAGLLASKGDYVFSIDADLQEPPEAMMEMFLIIHNNPNLDYIQAVRSRRQRDTLFKRLTASFYYKFIEKATGINIVPHAADFRVIKRSALEKVLNLPEKQKIFRLLLPTLRFNGDIIEVQRHERIFDSSKYNLRMMTKLAFNSLFGFSAKPLRLIAVTAAIMAVLFGVFAIITFFIWLNFNTVPGWTSLALLILSTQTISIICLSIMAEYISRIYTQVLDRPAFDSNEVE